MIGDFKVKRPLRQQRRGRDLNIVRSADDQTELS